MKTTIFFITLYMSSLVSLAQSTEQIKVANTRSDDQFQKAGFVPSGSPFSSSSVTNARLISSVDGTAAAINVAGVHQSSNGNSISGNIELSSPVSKNGVTRPASLDGLASDGKLTVGFQFKRWDNSPKQEKITRALKRYKELYGTEISSFLDLRDDKAAEDRLLDLISLGTPWFFGFTGTLNKQDYEFATDATLTEMQTDEKYSVNASAYVGLFVGKRINTLLKFSAVYQSVYKGNPSNEYLTPFNGGASYIKRELVVGGPTKATGGFYRGEVVWKFADFAGLNPSVTYRSGSSDVVFDLPVYLIQNENEGKMGLNGGIYLNYVTSSDQSFTMGIFIGTSLNELLKN